MPSSETPARGWKLEYADAFGAPLGTGSGQDNTFFPNRSPTSGCVTQRGYNPTEMENFTCGQVSVNPRTGMILTCSYGAPPDSIRYPGGSAINYDCGAAVSNGISMPAGYDGFSWLDNYASSSRTVVVEAKIQFPANYSADPAWWGAGPYAPSPHDGDENDWIEGWGWGSSSSTCSNGSSCALNWADQAITQPTIGVSAGGAQRYSTGASYGFDPSAALHTYDVLYRDNDTVQAYVDGRLLKWTSCNCTSFTPNPHRPEYLDTILSYAMRGGFTTSSGSVEQDPVPTFDRAGQSHTMRVRSVAVYQNASAGNAGMKQSDGSTTFPIIAPGTTVR